MIKRVAVSTLLEYKFQCVIKQGKGQRGDCDQEEGRGGGGGVGCTSGKENRGGV